MKVSILLTFLMVSSVALASEHVSDNPVKSAACRHVSWAAAKAMTLDVSGKCAQIYKYSPKSGHSSTAKAEFLSCVHTANQCQDSINPAWKYQRGCNKKYGFKNTHARTLCFQTGHSDAYHGRENCKFVNGQWQYNDSCLKPSQ